MHRRSVVHRERIDPADRRIRAFHKKYIVIQSVIYVKDTGQR